jgi:apolipoprotein N-acyltransferase
VQRHAGPITIATVFAFTVGLAVLAFPPFRTPELAYAMLVPGCFWAYRRPSFKVYALTLCAAQAVAWTVLLGWLHHVTWVGLFLLGPFVGAWVGSWYLAAWWILPRMPGRPTPVRLVAMLGLAGGWVFIEWTRTWLLGGFPWLPLAASQWERASILQVAAYTGAYGISFVLVAANLGFAAYAHRLFREGATGFNKRSQEFFLALFLLLACVSIHFPEALNRRGNSERLGRIGIVQPYIAQDVKWEAERIPGILEVLEKTTLDVARTKPDLILWPEASTPLAVRGHEAAKQFVTSLAERAKVPLLLGSVAIEKPDRADERWFNGVFLARPDTGIAEEYYAKRKLVPFGEFVPWRPVLGWIGKFVPIGGDFERGTNPAPLPLRFTDRVAVFGPMICYEDIYPQLARYSVLAGANALTVLTNNGWFGEGGAAYQHAAHSVLRAVENRRPVIRCGNGGWSGWIDEFGGIRRVVTNEKGTIYFRGAQIVDVQRDRRWTEQTTFYTENGDWFVFVATGLTLLGVALLRTAPPAAAKPGADGKEAA